MRLHHRLAIVGLALGLLALIASPASAHKKKFPTEIEVVQTIPLGEELIVVARVESPKPRCRGNRDVKLFLASGEEDRQLVDRGRSSRRGLIALAGNPEGFGAAIIRVEPERFGPRNRRHRHVCEPARTVLV